LYELKQKLNLTWEGDDVGGKPSSPGLKLSTVKDLRDYDDLKWFRIKPIHYRELGLNLIYCQYGSPTEPANLSTLSKPFDVFIWTGIGAISLILAIFFRDINIFLYILCILLGQARRIQKDFKIFLGLLLLLLGVINNHYLCILTRNLTSPLKVISIPDLDYMYNRTDYR
jgi:hypothetical protein